GRLVRGVRRPAGRADPPGGRGKGRARDRRGRLRAVPPQGGSAPADAARPGGDPGRVRAPRAGRARRRRDRPEPVRALSAPRGHELPTACLREPQVASNSGSGPPEPSHSMPVALLYLGILVAAFLLLIVRPQRRQMAAHRALVASLRVGDEVVTSGGIYGTIRVLDDGTVDLEVA